MQEFDTLPPYERRSFLRWLAKAAEKYFEDPEVQRRFKEWQKAKRMKEAQVLSECETS